MDPVFKAKSRVKNMVDCLPKSQLCNLIKSNPCLRGMVCGYISELKFREFAENKSGASGVYKPDDHDREQNKADLVLEWNGRRVSLQSKSIQTDSIRWEDGRYRAIVQNDASDKRDIALPNGDKISTTNYQVGEYDILVVPLYPLSNEWNFAFKLNYNCRRTKSKKYSEEHRDYLIATTEHITYPLGEGWHPTLEDAIQELCNQKSNP
jgi:hypothetical protein